MLKFTTSYQRLLLINLDVNIRDIPLEVSSYIQNQIFYTSVYDNFPNVEYRIYVVA